MNLPRFAVTQKSLVLVALALALFWSITSALGLQRREDPGTPQRATQIVTVWPGATTQNVEELVTKKIEDDLRGIAHVQHVTGTSQPGISIIVVELDDDVRGAAVDGVLLDVRHHLDDLRSALPPGINGPSIVRHFWDTFPVVVGVSAEGYTPRALRDLGKQLHDEISRLPDVGDVEMVGEQEQRVDVNLDVRRLALFHVTADQVVSALAQRNALVPDASMTDAGQSLKLSTSETLTSPRDVADTIVATAGAHGVRVSDVADVTTGYPDPPDELTRLDGKPAVVLAVAAAANSSVTTMGPEVRRFLAAAQQHWPAGVKAELIADQPTTVRDRLKDFLSNLIVGVILVTVLVSFFMGLRNALLVATTIALSIVLSFGVMPLLSVDIQQISIIALIVSIGMVVDAGIVTVDNIERLIREGADRRTAAWEGIQQLWFPLLTSTLVGMSSFVPYLILNGGIGDFVHDLGVVVGISLAMSLLVAYFITPILGDWFAASQARRGDTLVGRISQAFEALLERIRAFYVPFASAALRRPAVTAGVAAALMVGAFATIPHLGMQFFPPADRNQFFIDITAPDGTDIRTTSTIAAQVERLVARHPEVTTFGTFIGHGAPKFYYNVLPASSSPNFAQILVDTRDVASANRLVDELRQETEAQVAGARINVNKLEQGPPVGAPIQLRLTGDDPQQLAATSRRLQDVLRRIDGAYDVRDSLGTPTSTLAIRVDEDRARLVGASDAAIRSVLSLAYDGQTATEIRERDRETPVVVRLPAQLRHDSSAMAALPIGGGGGTTMLGEIATISPDFERSVSTIRDGITTVTVMADVVGRLPSAVLADFKRSMHAESLPPGVHLFYAGEQEQSNRALGQLLVAMAIGLFLMQIILVWEFRRLRLALVVLAAVPLGLVGAIFGLWLTHSPFGFTAALGIAGLGGVVTNHTIVLFEYAKRELAHGLSMEEALILAGSKRVRPILLTVVSSIAGLLPLALSGGGLWPPMCWAMIFGLAGSMVMTLVAIPAIYRLVSGSAALAPAHHAETGISLRRHKRTGGNAYVAARIATLPRSREPY